MNTTLSFSDLDSGIIVSEVILPENPMRDLPFQYYLQ